MTFRKMISEKSTMDRTEYFDYLRVFAAFSVMILHISAQNWGVTDINGFEWQIFNFYDSIVRWGVPVFVMISGALFLPREIPIKRIYLKYVLRMIIAFVVWSGIYSASLNVDMMTHFKMFIRGHYHMWYIPTIIGIYICIPFIREIIKKKVLIKYFLLLSFLFEFAKTQIVIMSQDFGSELLIKIVDAVYEDIIDMNLHMVLGYVSYFVLGYYLNSISLERKHRIIIYILGAIGFVLTIVLDSVVAIKTQTPCGKYYSNFTINVLFESIAVFTFFKYHNFQNARINRIVAILSKYSFGAYLVHALVIEQLDKWLGLNSLSFNGIVSVPVIGGLVFCISFGISAIINHIPILKKYIV